MDNRATASRAPLGRAGPDSLAPVALGSPVLVGLGSPVLVGLGSPVLVGLGSPVPVDRAGPVGPGRTTRSTTRGRAPPR